MKKWMKITLGIVGGIILLLVIDLGCVFIINRPLFAVKKDNVYRGLLYDTYNCAEYSVPQIKAKGTKFACHDVPQKEQETSNKEFDFYITKPEHHNDIRFNDYYTVNNRTIYLAGNLGEFYIKDQDSDITLQTYLSTAYQTFDDGIKSITDKLELKNTLKDGGTKIYKSKDKDITMIVCNTTKNDKNILIGDYSMDYTNGDCKN